MHYEREKGEGVRCAPHSKKVTDRQQLLWNDNQTNWAEIPFGSIQTPFNTEYTKVCCVNQ